MRKYLLIFFLLILAPLPQKAADYARIKEIGRSLQCSCGCGQSLGGCNHPSCPRSVPMEKELAEMLDQGLTKDQILDRFVAKYGAAILSAPPTKGAFNISAWIMPFVALLAGGVAVVVVLRKWNSQTVPATPEPADRDSDASRRLEEELKKFTPED